MPKDTSEMREIERWSGTYLKVIGALGTILLTMVAGVVWWYVTGVSDTHEQIQKQLMNHNELLAQRGERITKLETRVEECEKRKP